MSEEIISEKKIEKESDCCEPEQDVGCGDSDCQHCYPNHTDRPDFKVGPRTPSITMGEIPKEIGDLIGKMTVELGKAKQREQEDLTTEKCAEKSLRMAHVCKETARHTLIRTAYDTNAWFSSSIMGDLCFKNKLLRLAEEKRFEFAVKGNNETAEAIKKLMDELSNDITKLEERLKLVTKETREILENWDDRVFSKFLDNVKVP